MGFTRKPLTKKALKYRLTKMKVNYRIPVGVEVPPAIGVPVF